MAMCGRAAWPPRPSISIIEAVSRRHQRSGAERELADGETGIIVHPEHLLDAEALHQAVLHHLPPAAAALLGRLEDHHRVAGEIACLSQIARGAKQHGHMAVMTTGMHLPGHRRLVGDVGRLKDRQGIHIGAQADYLGCALPDRFVAADDADDTGAAEAGHHFVTAECGELFRH